MPVTHPRRRPFLPLTASLLLFSSLLCAAQTPVPATAAVRSTNFDSLPDAPQPQNDTPAPLPPPSKPEPITLAGTPKRILLDQKAIWTSPLHIRPMDAFWLLPLGAVTGTMIGSDQHTMNDLIHISPNDQNHFKTLSDAGRRRTRRHAYRHVSLEPQPRCSPGPRNRPSSAAKPLSIASPSAKPFNSSPCRERPSVDNARGKFFTSAPFDGSFPSNHAAAAWSLAAVVGDEYPGWLTRTAVYGLATAVSVSRVLAVPALPLRCSVGSATGWLIGHYVYRAHHNYTLNPFDAKPLPNDFGNPPPTHSFSHLLPHPP